MKKIEGRPDDGRPPQVCGDALKQDEKVVNLKRQTKTHTRKERSDEETDEPGGNGRNDGGSTGDDTRRK